MKKLIAILSVFILLLAVCAGDDTTYDEDGNVVLTIMSAWPEDTTNGAGQSLYQAAADFSAEDNGIVIQIDGQDGYISVDEKLQSAVSAGNEPVMAQIEEASLARFDGALANLDELIPSDVISNINEQFLLSSKNQDGELKVIPYNKSMPVLYVNMDLLEEGNYEVPTTWDELVATATDFHEKNPDKYGYVSDWYDDIWLFEAQYYSEGGTIDFTNGNPSFNNQAAKTVISRAQTMISQGVMPNPYSTPNADEMAYNQFQSGNALFKYESVSDYLTLKDIAADNGFDVQVFKQPAGSAGSVAPTGGSGLVILDSASDEEKQAAVEFIEYLMSDELVLRSAMNSGYIPITKSALDTDTWQQFMEQTPDYQNVIDQIEDATVRPYSKNWTEVRDILFDELSNDLAKPDSDLDESLKIVDENIQQVIGD